MSESERLERYCRNYSGDESSEDEKFRLKLVSLLGLEKDDFADAYYYDFSVIPYNIREEYGFCRDMYFVFGINKNGQLISKWIERYDVDKNL